MFCAKAFFRRFRGKTEGKKDGGCTSKDPLAHCYLRAIQDKHFKSTRKHVYIVRMTGDG